MHDNDDDSVGLLNMYGSDMYTLLILEMHGFATLPMQVTSPAHLVTVQNDAVEVCKEVRTDVNVVAVVTPGQISKHAVQDY